MVAISLVSVWFRFVIFLKMASLVSTLLLHVAGSAEGNPFAKRLYDDLLNNYNRLIRPVGNNTEKLTVWLKLKLSQLIDVVSGGCLTQGIFRYGV